MATPELLALLRRTVKSRQTCAAVLEAWHDSDNERDFARRFSDLLPYIKEASLPILNEDKVLELIREPEVVADPT